MVTHTSWYPWSAGSQLQLPLRAQPVVEPSEDCVHDLRGAAAGHEARVEPKGKPAAPPCAPLPRRAPPLPTQPCHARARTQQTHTNAACALPSEAEAR
eukprot:5878602-Prymnesium_polylepis.5